MPTHMSSTSIRLVDETKTRLELRKHGDESFEAVIERLLDDDRDLLAGFGAWSDTDPTETVTRSRKRDRSVLPIGWVSTCSKGSRHRFVDIYKSCVQQRSMNEGDRETDGESFIRALVRILYTISTVPECEKTLKHLRQIYIYLKEKAFISVS